MRARRDWQEVIRGAAIVTLLIGVGACFAENPDYVPPEDSGTSTRPTSGSETGASETGASETSSPSTSGQTGGGQTSGQTSDATDVDTLPSTTGSSFTSAPGTDEPTDMPKMEECDPYVQDCDDMLEKCSAKDANANGYLDTLTCAAYGSQGLNEPCNVNLETGDDTCAAGLACAGDGCREICSGSPDDPICLEGDTACFVYKDILPLCFPTCVPFDAQLCDNGLCVPNPDGEGFVCAPVGLGAEVGETCVYPNDCGFGLTCVEASELPECMGDDCCTQLCLTGNDECPGILECVSFDVPAYPQIGYCGVG